MSFSLEFVTSTKRRAKELVTADSNLPTDVRTFLLTAIDAMSWGAEQRERVISVKAVGHLSVSSGDYSNATIEVKPISLS